MRWLVLPILILAVACSSDSDPGGDEPCEFMGETYEHGELWLPDDCNACMCTDLGAECTAIACEECTSPPLDDCFTSHGYADCGGELLGNFGCNPDTFDCRWFEACLAEGYVRSQCGEADVCCVDGYPFPDRDIASLTQLDFFGWFYGHGTEPWTRERALDVSVAVDPDHAPGSVGITCDPDAGPGTPCGTPLVVGEVGDVVAIRLVNGDLGGWSLIVEIDATIEGGPLARACQVPFTDAWSWDCSTFDDPACATGALTVNRIPTAEGELAGTVGTLDVTFDGGLHLTGSFEL